MAKETGQRPPTPVAVVKRDISDSEGEDDGDGEPRKDGEPSKLTSKAKKKVSIICTRFCLPSVEC
jgi:hypothetical protein